jgi:hypothetical protein
MEGKLTIKTLPEFIEFLRVINNNIFNDTLSKQKGEEIIERVLKILEGGEKK